MTPFLSGAEIGVAQATAGVQGAPVIAALSGGGFIAVWVSPVAGSDEIRARLFLADGSAAGDEFTVNAMTAGAQGTPAVTELTDGRIAVG